MYRDNDEVNYAKPGENLRIRITGVEEEDISSGFVLSSMSKCPISQLSHFEISNGFCPLLNLVHFLRRQPHPCRTGV